MQTKSQLLQAFIQGDTKTLDRLLADNYISARGNSKQTILKNPKPMPNASFNVSKLKARMFGNSAEVTGRLLFKNHGADDMIVQTVDRLIKRQMGWQVISSRDEVIPTWQGKILTDSELTILTMVSCNQEKQLKSLNANRQTFLKFINKTDQPIILHWINYEGKRDPSPAQIEKIPQGKSTIRITYVTHPFIATDTTGKCLSIFKPNPEPSLAIIK